MDDALSKSCRLCNQEGIAQLVRSGWVVQRAFPLALHSRGWVSDIQVPSTAAELTHSHDAVRWMTQVQAQASLSEGDYRCALLTCSPGPLPLALSHTRGITGVLGLSYPILVARPGAN